MTKAFEDIGFADEIEAGEPDLGLETVRRFARAARMEVARFVDPEKAREEGLPGAIVPGIMSQGILVAAIHRWAPGCRVEKIDTVFRAPVLVDSVARCHGVVTDLDEEGRRAELDLTLTNEAGETRVLGTATVNFD